MNMKRIISCLLSNIKKKFFWLTQSCLEWRVMECFYEEEKRKKEVKETKRKGLTSWVRQFYLSEKEKKSIVENKWKHEINYFASKIERTRWINEKTTCKLRMRNKACVMSYH